MREVQGGRLTITAAPDIALYLLPEALGHFRRRYPAVDLSLDTGHSLSMAAMLLTDQAELALINRPLRLPELIGTVLYEEPLVPVVAPGHPLAGEDAPTLDSFAQAGLILREPGSYPYDLAVAFFTAGGLTPRIIAHTDCTEAARRLVLAGVGVGLLPELCVRGDVAQGRLVPVPLARARLPMRTIWALQRDDTQPSSAVRAFLEILSAEMPRGRRRRSAHTTSPVRSGKAPSPAASRRQSPGGNRGAAVEPETAPESEA
jgi:DNA-binding transcriptional LysR family regulator